jgi:hypothetical protein
MLVKKYESTKKLAPEMATTWVNKILTLYDLKLFKR